MASMKAALRGVPLLVLALATPVLLGGCFATQQDLDPIRSDISVLEKQFMEVQRDAAKAKVAAEEARSVPPEMKTRLDAADARLAAVEKRLDSLDMRVEEQKAAQASEPAAAEPIPAEPAQGVPSDKPDSEASAPQPPKGAAAAEGAFAEARRAYDAGEMDKAESGFRGFLAGYPADRLADDARFYLGEIYFSRGDYKAAVKEYDAVAKDYPTADRVPDALYRAGMACEELKDPARARGYYTRVVNNYPYSDPAKKASQRLDNLK